ncbi:hypothetical protein R1flu_011667 [Riccia fluitans]|uniref:Pectinesterase n=1 Tax=Riccia fluitans TaxID=41844 RepID=A0ABD1Z8N3_9MARC
MRVRQILVLLAVVAVCYSVFTVEATSGEPESEYMKWIKRMVEKHESKAPTETTFTDVSYASKAVYTIVVDQSGKGNFRTINSAIEAIPKGSSDRFVIHVKAGTYKENVKIGSGMGPITLQGEGYDKTKITYNLNAGKAGGTLKSASVSIRSENFIAKDIAFENSSPDPGPGAVNKQAVALEISGDKAAFYRCAFYGYQDTLYDRQGRHYFKDCLIVGYIDYIFGNGQSYYDSCTLQTIGQQNSGSLTAQKREDSGEDTGYSFVNCRVEGKGYVYLGRAWGISSRVVFIQTYFASIIRPEGWFNWGVPGREKTVYYGEYRCFGPGANRAGRTPWSKALTASQAQPFLTVDWIDGREWLPQGPQ